MNVWTTLLLAFLLSPLAWANGNDDVNAYRGYEHTLLATQQPALVKLNRLSGQAVLTHLHLANQLVQTGQRSLQHAFPHSSGGKAASGAMLFVSFSMPKPLLLAMIQQATQYHLPVLLRGLVNNSMPQTLQAVLDLKTLAHQKHLAFSGMGIDPVWFAQFDITAVPALVVTQRPAGCLVQKQCPNQPFDVIYGNQSLHDSLSQMARTGSPVIRPIATQLLHAGDRTP